MTAAHHSPGPWSEGDQITVLDSFGEKVALIYQGSETNLVGNRQAIVAVPAMLDLIKNLTRRLDAIGSHPEEGDTGDLVEEARTLIAAIERPGGRMGGKN